LILLYFNDMQTIYFGRSIGVIIAIFCTLSFTSIARAEEPCTIVDSDGRSTATDCRNPFGQTPNAPKYTVLVNGEVVGDGDSIPLVGGVALAISPNFSSPRNIQFRLYRHSGTEYLEQNLYPSWPDEAYFFSYIPIHFALLETRQRYSDILTAHFAWQSFDYFYDPSTNEDILDEETGEPVRYRFFAFMTAAEDAFVPELPTFPAGTYTAVFEPFELCLNYNNESASWFAKLQSFIIPTAHAQCGGFAQTVSTVTFTITEAQAEPRGASSILFLPGIQASRLYTRGALGFEDQLWTPNNNNDVRQLAMTTFGESIHSVYTRDVLDKVIGLGSVYSSFQTYLDNLVINEQIKDWQSFAYDWRYAVDDIVKNGTQYETEKRYVSEILEALAEDSFTRKVTVIGHSNGGLLAKVLIHELEKQNRADLVDHVILLASPQLGTPKAIGSMLHGYDQAILGGIILQADTARTVTHNLPGAYGLLPTPEYLTVTDNQSVVTFIPGVATDELIAIHGTQITNFSALEGFMVDRSSLREPPRNIYDIKTINPVAYDGTRALHTNILQPWRAPELVRVTEVAGVGLPTISGFEYRSYQRKKCETALFITTCTTEHYYKPVPRISLLGDETVMTASAEGYRGDKETYFLNLLGYREIDKIQHYNFTEATSIHNLVSNLIFDEQIDTPFITKVKNAVSEPYLMLGVHSPVMVTVTNKQGQQTKVTAVDDFIQKTETIPGSYIYYFGDTTYVLLPSAEDYDIFLEGTDTGVVTVELDYIASSGAQSLIQSLFIDEIATSTRATFSLVSEQIQDILVDVDGDGTGDFQVDSETNSKIILSKEKSVDDPTSNVLQQKRRGTLVRQSPPLPQVAGIATSSAQLDTEQQYIIELSKLLEELSRLLTLYEKIIK
jgi:pimeloyl-ACP methyl ester carboxylesterase